MTGYLTFENARPDPTFVGSEIVDLKIPNVEVAWIYRRQILSWFAGARVKQQYQSMLQGLLAGDRDVFKRAFESFVEEALGIFDVTGKHPERFYHGFMLGLLAGLRDTHEVISNRESGLGRYDVSIFPKDVHQLGIIMEFKVVKKKRGETLESEAHSALAQVEERRYEAAMRSRGITKILKIGIAFEGKKNLGMFG